MPIADHDLPRCAANHAPLTPLDFLRRTAEVHPQLPAIVHGTGAHAASQTWGETAQRCRRMASALRRAGVQRGDVVATLLPNTPPMVEAHFGVPLAGAVLNALNTRLEPASIAYMLDHGEARVILVDPEFSALLAQALPLRTRREPLLVVQTQDPWFGAPTAALDAVDYEDWLRQGDPDFPWEGPPDEWDAIALNYTSGTTGHPKGVVYHHRGAALNAVSNILEWDMPKHPVYLWTLPMFHCNGWCFPWTLAARAGLNVCLRKVDAATVLGLMRAWRVTHYCGAPIVHAMLANAPDELKAGLHPGIRGMVAASAPPAALLEAMARMGIELTHVYGLTEVYGPATVCTPQPGWRDLPLQEQARLHARQGVRYHLQQDAQVLDPATLQPVPWDGETIGEVMFRGNIVMKGYLKNPEATAQALAGGWFHTGDLAVQHPDGYIKIKDRSKDIIISGGENISSIEIEDVLYRHPAVQAAAVVAKPDPRWGETPCAFIELKPGAHASVEDIIAHCRAHLAGFKIPRAVVFTELPKTSTGKIQKFELRRLARSVQAIDV
ncbi:acyl-CoA synthetase [Tepidimonas ignava]|uniref:acyl-CoA synthetase n=1 Tax=Tepidimonas ignava TaxID=114249 RepID=UPI002FDAD003